MGPTGRPPDGHAEHGMVASVDGRASQAGVGMLRSGGSAADAAVAANAVLAVTAPHLCGMGGDLFALVHEPAGDGRPVGLNASGRAGSGADPAGLRGEGHRHMPFRGDIRTVTVPGCVDGWLALHRRFGRLPLAQVLEPARTYATRGFRASPQLGAAAALVGPVAGSDDLVAMVASPDGTALRPGLGRALEAVVAGDRAGFYQGEFGAGLVDLAQGYFTTGDLERPNAEWVEPLSVRVLGHDVWTVPPNSQGYVTLLGLAIVEGLSLPDDPDDGLWAHLLIESARLAAADRADLLHEHADARGLLAPAEVARRRADVDPERRAARPAPSRPGGTMFLAAVDRDRMGVSLIQSNAAGFGSHLFEPRTGINLHNRGIGFSLEPGHPAEYGPGRRPPHTLSPALVTGPEGSLRMVAGTMGGDSQPQILLQLLTRTLRHGQSPGSAVAAPRWILAHRAFTGFNAWTAGSEPEVQVEAPAPREWVTGLSGRGHDVTVVPSGNVFGHAQIIEVTDGALRGAADPRALIGTAEGF